MEPIFFDENRSKQVTYIIWITPKELVDDIFYTEEENFYEWILNLSEKLNKYKINSI